MEKEQQFLSNFAALNQILSQWVQAAKAVFPNITATSTSVGAAGGASALPATPLGYMIVSLPDGTTVKVPYYTE